ncbi:hypothetical protein ALP36_102775 [Pseudomonas syringae pv. coriandricola]|uniref:Uncharacterized protein n=4 Tax=Pseudomonas syringae group TaxID=136849 RepID=A0A0Q0A420_PSESX|nr:hypothetical protein PLA106_06795 [Pseudomonas amygdali pv. lachrymans str. M302278]KPW30492.1 hypothetical protein ALO87_102471 [Pseudomonas syringae pv. apii]KPW45576.1 hypothetical protein ALO86_102177 [Pseudomonas syringae pv. berberidis]KPY18653.1 hypothetical protein ALO54_102441 [Pseudomonas syringae pv. philadelphi]KPY67966.1 hypothetical protein ALO94_101019 [Pseudomonas syringae pv. spinaceae]RMM04722.1 hypothetical protein ALQ85_102504 [Pseudomonas syringae]RMM74920.1 hypothetic
MNAKQKILPYKGAIGNFMQNLIADAGESLFR